MTSETNNQTESPTDPTQDPGYESQLLADRLAKLEQMRDELGVNPYGQRVDGLEPIAEARAKYVEDAEGDDRAVVQIAGRVMLHRDNGKLQWLQLRDMTGDIQIAASRKDVQTDTGFEIARLADLGDLLVVEGPVMKTRTGEITVWASDVNIACKTLALPPEKFKGLQDAELRYRRRYVDMYVNPEVCATLAARSRLISMMRSFMNERGFLEVETPILQTQAGGAAARPFLTHMNALDLDLSLRIAPELFLKRLLVGGMNRVYEIGRNFRNEGVDRSHNPEFTAIEVYEAFGNYLTMLELTESMLRHLALAMAPDSGIIEFDGQPLNYAEPFRQVTYGDLFEEANGFAMTDFDRVRQRATELGMTNAATLDDWLLVNQVWEATVEEQLIQPTFVMDYPSAISPLTRPKPDNPALCDRWELMVHGMELGTAYTELNDPAVQEAKFRQQLKGADQEEQTYRTFDEDFLNALRVGMPPAGGLGLGVDRIIMLMTGSRTIRDVIPFPFMRPET
ncbi:MAG: lysine--tRNA ligase [Planctomycetes bacterium]|nr:lysine--tRNA ligase [Planctomycetota bacterium]